MQIITKILDVNVIIVNNNNKDNDEKKSYFGNINSNVIYIQLVQNDFLLKLYLRKIISLVRSSSHVNSYVRLRISKYEFSAKHS